MNSLYTYVYVQSFKHLTIHILDSFSRETKISISKKPLHVEKPFAGGLKKSRTYDILILLILKFIC